MPSPAGSKFEFTLSAINAPTTQKTSDFSAIEMRDSNGNQIASSSTTVGGITNIPAEVIIKGLVQYTKDLNVQSLYTITYTTMNAMPSGSTFLIKYPK